jgi:hypothetical protein
LYDECDCYTKLVMHKIQKAFLVTLWIILVVFYLYLAKMETILCTFSDVTEAYIAHTSAMASFLNIKFAIKKIDRYKRNNKITFNADFHKIQDL